jgi:hypothetical protein
MRRRVGYEKEETREKKRTFVKVERFFHLLTSIS